MFECAQAYPEYNAPCERNKRVKSRGTDHKGTENLNSKGKKQHRDITFAIKADASRAQYKRTAFACQSGHRMESATLSGGAKQYQNRIAQ